MLYIKVSKRNAESLKKKLMRSAVYDKSRGVQHSESYVLFPVSISDERVKKLISGTDARVVNIEDKKNEPQKGYRGALREVLTQDEYDDAVKSYDLLGNIAIIEIPVELKKKAKRIANVIMWQHPSVKTVLAKASAVSGKLRIRKFSYVAGEKTTIATYRENGCVFKFDVTKTFFSNRLSFERARIVQLSKKKENVLVLFSGVGPFAIEIAKANPKANVVAVELNKYACKSAEENKKLNKTPNVKVINGDVRMVAKDLKGFANRIIVPMPTASMDFLDEILLCAKKKAVVHLYLFGPTVSVFEDAEKRLNEHAKKNGYSVKILFKRIARTYSPKEIELVIDYALEKK